MAISYTIPQFLAMLEGTSVQRVSKDVSFLTSVENNLTAISEFCNFILHPSKILLLLWNWTFELSYIVCLLISLYGFFMVLTGSREHKKYVTGGIVSYFFMNIINEVVKGVMK